MKKEVYIYCTVQTIILLSLFFGDIAVPLLIINGIFHGFLGLFGLIQELVSKIFKKEINDK